MPTKITLTPDQSAAKTAFDSGKNMLLTGPAGTGKSTLLNFIREDARGGLAICASTGIAALGVGGTTLHSWAGLGLGDKKASAIAGMLEQRRSKAWENICMASRLAIDEISMIDGRLLTLTDQVFRRVRRNSAPFGGIQMLLIGDFLQLPPVVKDRSDNYPRFAFNSPSWREAEIETHLLTTIIRQKDVSFAQMLNEVRVGRVTPQTVTLLNSRVRPTDTMPDIKPVILESRNAEVEAYNLGELAKIPGEAKQFHAADTGYPEQVAKIQRDCIAPTILSLKPGAQVMLLKNLQPDVGLVNGSMGKVREIDKSGRPVVDFVCGETMTLDRELWQLKNGDTVLAQRSQYPLRLAWSLTIHKSQGMTLDKVEADISSCFEHGQAYVALSRAKTLDGLFLKAAVEPRRITADPDALSFYEKGAPECVHIPGELDFMP